MTEVNDHEWHWFRAVYLHVCATKHGEPWETFVTEAMQGRHGGAFIQVDATGRGDKGCDGFVNGLMLACYGAKSAPKAARVAEKLRGDFQKALRHWSSSMRQWAFVHNNVDGISLPAAETILKLRAEQGTTGVEILHWPPGVLWDEAFAHLNREQLSHLLGPPPSDYPPGITYIGECVRSLARSKTFRDDDDLAPVPYGKIEHNGFGSDVRALLIDNKVYTHHVGHYLSQSSPGEQEQAAYNIRLRYDMYRAKYEEADEIFIALCDDLLREAFNGGQMPELAEQQRAAQMVVTYFFEECQIFEPAPRRA